MESELKFEARSFFFNLYIFYNMENFKLFFAVFGINLTIIFILQSFSSVFLSLSVVICCNILK